MFFSKNKHYLIPLQTLFGFELTNDFKVKDIKLNTGKP